MTRQADTSGILDFLICPGFSVKNHIITACNQAAAAMLLTVGTDIRPLLCTGNSEYADFQGGCMYLTLSIGEKSRGAAVIRREDTDYFLLDNADQDSILGALSLAARELRSTLTGTISCADQLTQLLQGDDSETMEQLSRLNRGLYRTLRLIANMSDADDWPHSNRQRICNAVSVFQEIFEKAQNLTASTGITLTFCMPSEEVITMMDPEQIERAVLNLLSNALKFTPAGGTISANLTRSGRMLRLSIQDSGSGIPEDILSSVFNRYLRQPGLEDSRFGLGLGMTLVRNAASAHGGTVLLDQPDGNGTRVTMTLAIRQSTMSALRSPMVHLDYTGERDHALVELSDCLPLEHYR